MSEPNSRSASLSSDSRAVAPSHRTDLNHPVVPVTSELAVVLSKLGDETAVKGKHAKALRDATVHAINDVWTESKEVTTMLTHSINEGNSVLLADLNQSFAAVGERINKIPLVASLSPDGPLPRIVPFIGSGEDPMQFSMWLRRLVDVMRMRSTSWSSQQKACFLIGYLDGVAREKVEELSEDERRPDTLSSWSIHPWARGVTQRRALLEPCGGMGELTWRSRAVRGTRSVYSRIVPAPRAETFGAADTGRRLAAAAEDRDLFLISLLTFQGRRPQHQELLSIRSSLLCLYA